MIVIFLFVVLNIWKAALVQMFEKVSWWRFFWIWCFYVQMMYGAWIRKSKCIVLSPQNEFLLDIIGTYSSTPPFPRTIVFHWIILRFLLKKWIYFIDMKLIQSGAINRNRILVLYSIIGLEIREIIIPVNAITKKRKERNIINSN